MHRISTISLSLIFFAMSGFSIVDARADQKQQLLDLHHQYKESLKDGNNRKSLRLARKVYDLAVVTYDERSKIRGTAAFNLAQMLERNRRYKAAARFYQEHIDILDDLQAAHDENYLFKLRLSARAYRAGHMGKKAVEQSRKALDLAEELKLLPEIIAENELDLGISYYSSFGEGARAKRYIDMAHNHLSELYGQGHFKTAEALFWQAKVDFGYGKYRRSAKKLETVLEIYEKTFPKGHDRILQVHAFLVGAYEEDHEKEKATEHCIAVATERAANFDRDITPLYKTPPIYPRFAAENSKEGQVITEFTVDENGQVRDIKTIGGYNYKIFEKAAHEAIVKFRYAPSIENGQRVETTRVTHRLSFKMAD